MKYMIKILWSMQDIYGKVLVSIPKLWEVCKIYTKYKRVYQYIYFCNNCICTS